MASFQKKNNLHTILICIGIAAIVFGAIKMIPMIINRISLNSYADNSTTVTATVTSKNQTTISKYNIVVSYQYEGKSYDNITMKNVKASSKVAAMLPNTKAEIFISKSDPTDCRTEASKELNASEKHTLLLYGTPALIGIVLLIIGIVLSVYNKKNAAISGLTGMNNPINNFNGPDNMPPYGAPDQSFSSAPPMQPPMQQFTPAPPAQPYMPEPPAAPQYNQAPPAQNYSPVGQPYQNTVPSNQNYSSIPYPVDNAEKAVAKPFGRSSAPAAPTTPAAPAAPTAPATPAAPAAQQAPSVKLDKSEAAAAEQPKPAPAPSKPVDLNSIIKKGTDDAFSMKADDYEVDPALAALIRKGGDDPFNSKAEDYQVDPALAALIKTGSDDPFRGRPAPEQPKEDE